MNMLANLFGNILNILYNIFNNYGVAIIIFSILLRSVLLPITIKQQKTMKKSAEMQKKMNALKEKYKNDQEKLSQEMMALYKNEKMNPFSGCLSSILQIIIILAVFYVVKSPLTYMKKIDSNIIDKYKKEIVEQNNGQKSAYEEIEIIQKKGNEDPDVNINMEFLGINLSKIPNQNLGDFKIYIIPVLYVISSFISIRVNTAIQKNSKDSSTDVIEVKNDENSKKNDISEEEAMEQMSKNMNLMMPIISISIAMVAPLGLALYWLISNILMIAERVIIDRLANKEVKREA